MKPASLMSPRERHSLIDDAIFLDPCERIIDRSRLIGWKSRRYTLVADHPTPESKQADHFSIYMTEFVQYRNKLERNTYSETEEIPTLDCPMRIIEAADQLPASNQYAQEWRNSVRHDNSRRLQILKLLKDLARYYPRIDDRIVIWPAHTVHYICIPNGRKNRHHYFTDQQPRNRTLTPTMINLHRTEELRSNPLPHS